MDFLDPAKKRAHTRRLYIGYALMGIAIMLTAVILLVLSNGYDVDRKTGKVIQNGLIFLNATPDSADIYLNGKANGTTDERITVPEGKYAIELRREGYATWKKTIQLDGGNIERLVYPRLFPSKLSTAVSQTYSGIPAFSTQSPDRRWVLVALPGQLSTFEMHDTANPADPVKTINLPSGTMTAAPATVAQSLSLAEWSTDNRHVVLKHTYGDAVEFIMLDRTEPTLSVNLNKVIGLSPTMITLRDKKYDKLHVYVAATKELRFFDLKTAQNSLVLSGVISYKSYRDSIVLYSAADPLDATKTQVRIKDGDKNYLLRSFSSSDVLTDMAAYGDATYVALASPSEAKTYIYKNPISRFKQDANAQITPFVLMRFAGMSKLLFSNNTRFISLQSGTKFSVYDLEENRRYTFTIPGELAADQFATWMDGHRLLLNHAGTVHVVVFDGKNQLSLGSIVPGSLPYFDRDYERLYTLSPDNTDAAKTVLRRTSLKVKLKP